MAESSSAMPGRSALAGIAATTIHPPAGSGGGIVITDTGLVDKINLRCDDKNTDIAAALENCISGGLAGPNRFTRSGERMTIRLGPDEWLITAETGAAETIMATLKADTHQAAAVEVSDAVGGVTVKGNSVRHLLAKHCGLDLDPSAFTAGMAAQTLLSHASVIILCTDDDAFMILGRSSFMPYLVNLLLDAGAEYGVEYRPAD